MKKNPLGNYVCFWLQGKREFLASKESPLGCKTNNTQITLIINSQNFETVPTILYQNI